MKIKLFLILSCLFLFLSASLVGCSSTDSKGLAYEVNSDGKTCTIVGKGSCLDKKLSIPREIKGYTVTCIGNRAFCDYYSLTSVTIPDSVTTIEYGAFSYCTSLTSITIPKSVTKIEDYAFSGCTNLIHTERGVCYVDNWVVDFDSSFKKLRTIELRRNTVGIADEAFRNCTALTNITIPYKITNIGMRAFSGCTSLTSIEIPDGVTNIQHGTFEDCTALTSITIPNSVTSIQSKAFSGCHALSSVTIPDSVTTIDASAFYDCSSLTKITIPNSVTSIGESAFEGCLRLYRVCNESDLPLTIGSRDTGHLACYAKILVDKNGNSIKKETSPGEDYIETTDGFLFMKENDTYTLLAYYGDQEIVSFPLTINGSLYTIRPMCGICHAILPDGMMSIDARTFSGCRTLESITIPNSVTSIGEYAFLNCASLTSIAVPAGVTNIDKGTFFGCVSLKSIVIPNSVTSIDSAAFLDCASLNTVYYTGTEADWKKIDIYHFGNDTITSADRYYYSEVQPTNSGNYWHYVDGVPTKW